MRRFILIVTVIVNVIVGNAQQVREMQRPKLVVGIMVDQMRWDYLTRYYDRYTDGGFKRLMAEGYNCNRLLINYLPAITAAGHTCVYTGSVPALTGIIGNNFPINGNHGTSVQDETVQVVGNHVNDGASASKKNRGSASPRKLLANTITDELRLATNFRSKTIGISLKDRAAILPAGHSANGAYWFDSKSLNFITSTYYMNDLPQWVKDFNKSGKAQSYTKMIENRKNKEDFWDLLYPEETYIQSSPEKHLPYFAKMTPNITLTPWGNTITADMAIAAIEGENLGNNPAEVPDFLALSFSTPDLVGHQLGTTAIWQEDVFLRLDKDIALLLTYLDDKIGKDNYVVFLSADHGGMQNPEFLKEHKIPAGDYRKRPLLAELNDTLKVMFHTEDKIINNQENQMLYLNPKYADNQEVMDFISHFMEKRPEIQYCFSIRNMPDYIPEPIRSMTRNGYCPGRSGDMEVIAVPQYLESGGLTQKKEGELYHGNNHSMWNPYDTHIPFIIMGKNIRHAWDNSTHYITDISATLAAILNIQQPNACVGEAIDVLK